MAENRRRFCISESGLAYNLESEKSHSGAETRVSRCYAWLGRRSISIGRIPGAKAKQVCGSVRVTEERSAWLEQRVQGGNVANFRERQRSYSRRQGAWILFYYDESAFYNSAVKIRLQLKMRLTLIHAIVQATDCI